MRDQILSVLRPAIERLVNEAAEQLATIAVQHINQVMNQLELAFDVASSAFESDLSVTDGAARQHDVRGKGRVDRAAAQPRSRRVDNSGHSPRSAQVDTESDEGAAASTSPDTKPSPDRALQQGQDLPPSTSSVTNAGKRQRGVMRCKKCGALGFRSDGCGTSHTTLTSPASAPPQPDSTTRSSATSSIPARRAQVESAATKRERLAADRDARARSFIKPRTPRAPSSEAAPPSVEPAAIPDPIATFQFNPRGARL